MTRTARLAGARRTKGSWARGASAVALLALACSGRVQHTEASDAATASGGAGGTQTDMMGGKPAGGTAAKSGAGNVAPPAQAAVTLKISPTAGRTCAHTNGQLSAPSAQNASVYGELLGCDLSQGCKPDEYVVVDRDRNTHLTCLVAPSGDTFNVTATLNVADPPSMQFQVAGTLSPLGGTVAISESNSIAQGGGSDSACTVTITPNRGAIGRGKVWATFTCTMFRDPNDLADTGCTVEGAFLFENCAD
jgi:hypothetical protein